MRPVGGWLSDRFRPVPVLTVCFGAAAALARAGRGRSCTCSRLGTVAFLGHGRGARRGAGATASPWSPGSHRAEKVGGVTGLVGAAGASAGSSRRWSWAASTARPASYAIGLLLLALVALAAAASPGWSCAAKPATVPRRRTPVTHTHHTRNGAPRTWTATSPRRWCAPAASSAGRGVGRPADAAPDRRPRRRQLLPGPLEPRQGRPLHPRRELHRLVLVEGLRQGRDHHLGGPADRLPVGRGRTGPSTSPAAARAAPRSPGTPTRRPGSATPTSAASLLQMYREAKARHGDPVPAWARRRREPRAGAGATSPRAARAGWCAPPGTRPPRWSPPRTSTRSRGTGPDRVAGFSPIPAMSMVSHAAGARFVSLIGGAMLSFYDWYADLPVASPAGVRRPDRRARVRRLVGRLLPDPVGLQRPGDPHAGRALDDRGPLPRPEGRRDEPGLLRRHQVRRRLARRAARHGRGARDGDGSRRPQGVLRRPAGAAVRRLRASSTPTCRSWSR